MDSKKVILLCLGFVLFISMSLAGTWKGGGIGTQSSPYTIDSCSNLDNLLSLENSDLMNAYYELVSDIDCFNTSISPIGGSSNPFNGNFDGNGYAIVGLNISKPYEENVGLFGYIGSSGVVKNLHVTDSTVIGGNNVGGIAGFLASGGRLINCSFESGNVSGIIHGVEVNVSKNDTIEDYIEEFGGCVDATDKSSCKRDGCYWYNGQCNECSSVAPILWEGNCKSNAQMSEICEIQNREYTFGASYCGDCKEGCEEHDGLCITPSTEVGCTQLGLIWCGNNCYVSNSNKVCFQNEYISKNTMCQSQGKVYNSSSNSCFCNAGYKADPNGNCLNDAGCPESTPEVFDGECRSMEYIINECHESQKRNIGYIYTFSGDKVYSYCDDCLSGYTEVDGKCVSI